MPAAGTAFKCFPLHMQSPLILCLRGIGMKLLNTQNALAPSANRSASRKPFTAHDTPVNTAKFTPFEYKTALDISRVMYDGEHTTNPEERVKIIAVGSSHALRFVKDLGHPQLAEIAYKAGQSAVSAHLALPVPDFTAAKETVKAFSLIKSEVWEAVCVAKIFHVSNYDPDQASNVWANRKLLIEPAPTTRKTGDFETKL